METDLSTLDTATKNQLITARLIVRMARGESVQDALDAELGAGTYKRLAGELWEALLWEALRRKQGLPTT